MIYKYHPDLSLHNIYVFITNIHLKKKECINKTSIKYLLIIIIFPSAICKEHLKSYQVLDEEMC